MHLVPVDNATTWACRRSKPVNFETDRERDEGREMFTTGMNEVNQKFKQYEHCLLKWDTDQRILWQEQIHKAPAIGRAARPPPRHL